jgi:hypothetical protein
VGMAKSPRGARAAIDWGVCVLRRSGGTDRQTSRIGRPDQTRSDQTRSDPRKGQQAPGFCWQNADPSPAPPLADVPVPPPVPLPPPPPVPPPPEGVVPVPAPAPPDGVVPAPAPAPPDGVVPGPALVALPALPALAAGPALALVSVVLVLVVLVVLLVTAELTDGSPIGTVKTGAPGVSVVPEPPPPQADTPSATASETTAAVRDVDLRVRGWLMPTRRTFGLARRALRSRAAPCACRRRGSR